MVVVDKCRFRYEDEVSYEKRIQDVKKVVTKYPNRIPIVCEWLPRTKSSFPPLEKKKFLVPQNMNVGQFRAVIFNALTLKNESTALYFTCKDNTTPISTILMRDLYEKKKSEDGFLYLHFSEESVFG